MLDLIDAPGTEEHLVRAGARGIASVLALLTLASCHTGYTGVVRVRPDEASGSEVLSEIEAQLAVDLFRKFAVQRGYELDEMKDVPAAGVVRLVRARGPISLNLVVTESGASSCLFLYTFSGGRPPSFEALASELRDLLAAEFGEERTRLRWQWVEADSCLILETGTRP